MYVIKTDDEMYPVKFDDSWGGGAYLSRSVVMNDKQWDEFIRELNKIREEVKREGEPKMKTVKITSITDEAIEFSDGSRITFDHEQDCCEWNYADFEQLDDLARAYTFQLPLRFEAIKGSGFRFGDSRRMFFVPCYSEQNGYYTDEIDIYYSNFKKGNEPVLSFNAEFRDD